MFQFVLSAHLAVLGALRALVDRRAPHRSSRGQSTAEYALVLLGAAAVALAFLAWVGSSGRIEGLLDSVLDSVIGNV